MTLDSLGVRSDAHHEITPLIWCTVSCKIRAPSTVICPVLRMLSQSAFGPFFPMGMETFPKHIICSALRGHKGTGGRPSSLPLSLPPHHHPHRSHPLRAPVHPSLQPLGENAPPRLCDYEVKHVHILQLLQSKEVAYGFIQPGKCLLAVHSFHQGRPTDRHFCMTMGKRIERGPALY